MSRRYMMSCRGIRREKIRVCNSVIRREVLERTFSRSITTTCSESQTSDWLLRVCIEQTRYAITTWFAAMFG